MNLDVTKLFVSLQIFEKATDIPSFKSWLKTTHQREIDGDIFSGYRYFIESSFRLIFSSFEYDYSFGLNESELLRRASHEGKHIVDFKPDCEKTIFLCNFFNCASALLKANNLSALEKETAKFKKDTLSIFQNVISKTNFRKEPLPKDEFTRCLLIGNLYIYFHQFANNKAPYAHLTSLLGFKIPDERLKRALEGYKFTLQFLWYQLLKKDEITGSIKNIHKAKGWTEYDNFDRKTEKTKIKFISEDDKTHFDNGIFDRRVDLRKRKDLDSYFWRIKRDIIDPLSNKVGFDIVVLSDAVFLKKQPPKKIISEFLKAPKYEKEKDLGEILLWYPAEYIHSRKSSMHFGVPAFNTLMAGAVELKRHHKVDSKIRVLRFVHPHTSTNSKQENDYTYGVLLNSYHHDNLYDKGWILLFNSCGDYSGFSGSEHNQAEALVKHYSEKGEIDIETIKIDYRELEDFLGERSTIYRNENELGVKVNQLQGRDKEMKGFLFEMFCSYYISKTQQNVEVVWSDAKEENNEVDILVSRGNMLEFIECKINPDTIDMKREIEKLRKKIEMYPIEKSKTKKLFLFWKEPDAAKKRILADMKMRYEFLSLTSRNKLNANKHIERLFAIFDGEGMDFLDMLGLEIEE